MDPMQETTETTTEKLPPAGLDALDAIQQEQRTESEELAAAVTKGQLSEKQAAAQKEAEAAAARMGAAWAVGFLEQMVKTRVPYAAFDPDTAERLTDKTAAVMAKHGGGMPPWLAPYKEEIELGVALASAGFGVYVQVKQYEHEQEVKRQEAQARAANGQPALDLSTGQGAN